MPKFLFKCLSVLYALVVSIRNYLYSTGILKAYMVVPVVISIGNIEVGGTGKTPFVISLAEELHKRGYNVAIVTRGYKGRMRHTIRVQGDDSPKDVGDEALLMAKTTNVPVIKACDRIDGATYAKRTLGSDIVILDDGFQHRRIYRDMDIVLVSRSLDKEDILPLGHLREPISSLGRADIVIYTKSESSQETNASFVPEALIGTDGARLTPFYLRGKDVLAFCGIARPDFFFEMVEAFGAKVKPLRFKDHHWYTPKDIRRIKDAASHRDLIVTTEKDMVRLDRRLLDNKWYALKGKMVVPDMDKILGEVACLVKDRRISR
ncbi:MAG: tetraacyldisaccharide 4'-kinase [Deltaproteobacteria bacterium]|nr:tetraacyldisaccharide 4'-kinase [Deltaproteobacteria bacterium]